MVMIAAILAFIVVKHAYLLLLALDRVHYRIPLSQRVHLHKLSPFAMITLPLVACNGCVTLIR